MTDNEVRVACLVHIHLYHGSTDPHSGEESTNRVLWVTQRQATM